MFLKKKIAVILLWSLSAFASADALLQTGKQMLRHHLQILSEHGVINTPINTWPLNWGNIEADIDQVKHSQLSEGLMLSLQYVQFELARQTQGFVAEIGNTLSSSPNPFRGFDDEMAGKSELYADFDFLTGPFSGSVRAAYIEDPLDGKRYRFDGSYIAGALGNWALGYGAVDRWWGPGWNSSLILSNNARPTHGFFLKRNSDAPIDLPLLNLLGRWQLEAFASRVEREEHIGDADLYGLKTSFKPVRFLEIGAASTQISNKDKSISKDVSTFYSVDARISFKTGGFGHGIYGQLLRDEDNQIEAENGVLAGYEVSLVTFHTSHRVVVEYAKSPPLSSYEWGPFEYEAKGAQIAPLTAVDTGPEAPPKASYDIIADGFERSNGCDGFCELTAYGYENHGLSMAGAILPASETYSVMGHHYHDSGIELEWKWLLVELLDRDTGEKTGEKRDYFNLAVAKPLTSELKAKLSGFYLNQPIYVSTQKADSGVALSLIYRY